MTRGLLTLLAAAVAAVLIAVGGFAVGQRTVGPAAAVDADGLEGWERIGEQTYYYRAERRNETAQGGVETIAECIALVVADSVALDCIENP